MKPEKRKTYFAALVIIVFLVSSWVLYDFLLENGKLYEKEDVLSEAETGEYKDIIGCWREYSIIDSAREETALRKFSLSEDKFMEMRYELGSRCRIWISKDKKISYENGHLNLRDEFEGQISEEIISLLFEGDISEDRSSFLLKGKRYDILLVRVEDEETAELMDNLESSLGGEYTYRIPEKTGDGLSCGDLSDVNIDKEEIAQLVHRITEGTYGDIHGVLIAKDGNLVFEEYFGADGQVFGLHINQIYRDRYHSLRSATKSITSMLIGIAIDHGYITGVDEPAFEVFPEYAQVLDEKKRQIQLEHLLTMTSGLEWNELELSYADPKNDFNKMGESEDTLGYLLEKPVVVEPGTQWSYNSGISVILGEILKRKTGIPADEYARTNLFEPLGISDYAWYVSPEGLVATSGGLMLRPRDLVKIGLFFLNNGRWEGTQIISEEWIQTSTYPHVKLDPRFGEHSWYGYQWRVKEFIVQGQEIESYYAMGYGGVFLFVFPESNTVVVFTADNYKPGFATSFLSMIENYILPAVAS
ncbi:MAG: serine hydrolase [Theionarchaea archaeon]|nr:serine hydrolase [Theionarchaea archaeon]